MSPDKEDLTQLLRQSRAGDQNAVDQAPGFTLQPTALVHEAYIRLVDRSVSDWKDQVHFFNLAATIMRQILVDHARAKVAAKRGGGRVRVELEETLQYSAEKAADLLALDDPQSACGL